MKRKFLEDLGLEKETIDKILNENSTDIGKAKGEFDSVNQELTEAKAELKTANDTIAERDTQLEELRKSANNNEELQKQITDLQQANQQKDIEMKKEIQRVKREGIDELLLSEAGAKNLKAAKAMLEALEEEDDEKYKHTRSEQIKALAEAEETKFMFGTKKLKGTEPGEGGGEDKPDFENMSYDELTAYLVENPETTLE